MLPEPAQNRDYPELARQIKAWARDLGFSGATIGRAELPAEVGQRLLDWLAAGHHGEMDYMARHGLLRARPAELVPGALSVVSVRLPYRDPAARDMHAVLADGDKAAIARYALGRDYHKTVRNRLQKLADRLHAAAGPLGYRVFSDSAPLMEVALAAQSGLGWRGKHTLLIHRDEGSFFFLGELLTDLPLPADAPVDAHCGRCTRCLDVCPTQAIVAPYQVDARRCISYLTIELAGAIPEPLRPLIGNRVYGCDDCQLVCPWNRFAVPTAEADFAVRHGLDDASLVSLFAWEADEFAQRMAGSPIYRIGHERWLRNLAVGLGNAPSSPAVTAALLARREHPSALVREHVAWALARHGVL
ncbi:MAG: tRNA epoxyqueuosine(34) reductase QueG [Rivihabitans pingtungensis]|jgi:epoxyqueuosine reductase|uniref:tRNA epoxyqueuosine(34) reductase QueG n=1 Tax=Rivihabitans pingtungensis TaxID=1054498 RepID=UPI0023577720|nr:tRNA epoxyqueuosine(34) reductase QueG [Rivihabitans pingtungensis]MCK6438143.1 tRNA epoxyqueuosine(34) reductase QueG [Rivihabitans pingtungensis]HNX71336.1 tRNA epoxyqueuosine(34) reductase QueG [Rivihabitans pingtungensis]